MGLHLYQVYYLFSTFMIFHIYFFPFHCGCYVPNSFADFSTSPWPQEYLYSSRLSLTFSPWWFYLVLWIHIFYYDNNSQIYISRTSSAIFCIMCSLKFITSLWSLIALNLKHWSFLFLAVPAGYTRKPEIIYDTLCLKHQVLHILITQTFSN